MGDDDAAPVVFKKPARKANMRKRKVEADDADAGEAGEASGGPRCAEGPAQPARTPCARTRLELSDGCRVAVRRSR